MTILNCYSFEHALASLATGAGVDQASLLNVIRSHDPSTVPDGEDHWTAIPRDVLAALDVDVATVMFDECRYFHGTRTADHKAFRREGILPLGKVIEKIWATLRELCPEATDAEWAAFRAAVERTDRSGSARLYQMKLGNPIHHGPYGSLVREHVLHPIVGQHDYLASPEIVEDIAQCNGYDLQRRFNAVATMCIVGFRSKRVSPSAVYSALLYVYAKGRGEPIGESSVDGRDCNGVGVDPQEIVSVDLIFDR